jgi:hypothetical protein
MTPPLRGETCPEPVRRAIGAARKAATSHERAIAERARAAQTLRAASEAAALADEAALAAGEDVSPVDAEAQAEAALRLAERRAEAAERLARSSAAALAEAIRENAEPWLGVLLADLDRALGEGGVPGLAAARAHLEDLDLAARRYWFVRALAEGRHPSDTGPHPPHVRGESDPRPIAERALAHLEAVDALVGHYRPAVDAADAARAEGAAEAERRAEWERKRDAENEREREIQRARDAERRARYGADAEVIR